MTNYEIMILVNPQSSDEEVRSLLLSVLDEKNTKIERLERTELAYEIKGLNRATYYLVNTKTDNNELTAELTRKLNIAKNVLRTLIINMDSEKGLKPRKQKRFARAKKQGNERRPRYNRDNRQNDKVKAEEK